MQRQQNLPLIHFFWYLNRTYRNINNYVDEQVALVNDSIQDIWTELGNVQTDLDDLTARVAKNEEDIEVLGDRVGSIEDEQGNQDDKIDDLEDRVDALEATPTPTPSPIPTPPGSMTVYSQDNLDGFVSSSGGVNQLFGLNIGRNNIVTTRGFVSFGISSLPEGYTPLSATLKMYQADTTGNPYGVGGNLVLDHLDYGDSLDSGDYLEPAFSDSFDYISTEGIPGWYEVDVTDKLLDDLSSGRERTQFRLHFVDEIIGVDPSGDYAHFDSARGYWGSSYIPMLYVEY